MQRLSLCMIVRDEEQRLARCLESVRNVVDEIVVVDTGSRDNTRAIAERFGAKVVDFTWCDDFAAARNASMDAASGEWLLFLDADEVLSPEAGKELLRCIKDARTLGAFIPLHDVGEGAPNITTLLFRAVRRISGLRWRYRIHEQILPDANRVARSTSLRFVTLVHGIEHDGYSHAVMESKDKRARNRRLFAAQVGDTPNDPYILYKFGDFLRTDPETHDEGQAYLQRAFDALRGLPPREVKELTFAGEVAALLALGLMRKGEIAEATKVIDFGLTQCRPSGHLLYARGQVALAAGDLATAEQSFGQCMANGKGALLIPATAKVTTQLAPTGRAAALLGLGRAREAMELVAPLLPLVPDDEDVIRIHAEATLACGDPRSALMQLTAALTRQPQAASLWHCGAQMLFRLRLSVKALDWVQRARHLGFDPRAVDGLEGEILLVAGDLLGAEAAFRRQPQDARCAGGLALVQEMNGQSDNPLVDKRACAERERMRANCGLARAGSA